MKTFSLSPKQKRRRYLLAIINFVFCGGIALFFILLSFSGEINDTEVILLFSFFIVSFTAFAFLGTYTQMKIAKTVVTIDTDTICHEGFTASLYQWSSLKKVTYPLAFHFDDGRRLRIPPDTPYLLNLLLDSYRYSKQSDAFKPALNTLGIAPDTLWDTSPPPISFELSPKQRRNILIRLCGVLLIPTAFCGFLFVFSLYYDAYILAIIPMVIWLSQILYCLRGVKKQFYFGEQFTISSEGIACKGKDDQFGAWDQLEKVTFGVYFHFQDGTRICIPAFYSFQLPALLTAYYYSGRSNHFASTLGHYRFIHDLESEVD